ncbi:ABC transporter substrate-binding protein [Paenibacillus darwinianus]|uniref:ABC transporter substrate-binding protein n=1 Tax=Paenibacillus darwinianus TaxID=1380763 RepID=A0A9W5S3E1_9BACL|nr:ABC transporter substrate-binding protein [Paenibacillus darwinianus]EXX85072.1 ABC transporter substrate-binding protein [Paenibacillus darwinianus]EXX90479.1 ABC transporter substrate-binding protein [Paenibacillus darwinianus]EXX91124.1 ABC transporter substrate-binding protein [Paenibacillus darwinianus]
MNDRLIRKFTAPRALRLLMIALLAMLLTVLAACGAGSDNAANGNAGQSANGPANEKNDGQAANSGEEQQADDAEIAQTTYPLTLTDATGKEVTIEKSPAKIVSITPSETEILFAIGAGSVVAGVDDNSNYPAETAELPKVGGFKMNVESVAGLNPDLVIANASMNGQVVEELRALNIVVFASQPKTIDETIAHVEEVGVITNKQAEAKAVADKMRADKQAVVDVVKGAEPKSVYLEFSPGWTVGSGEFLDEIVTLAGGKNVAASQPGWFEIDPEAILKANPQVILYPEIDGDTSIPDAINSRPGWDQIDAVKNKQVFTVPNDPLVRVGPRLTDGLRDVAKAIHPDLFN